MRQLERQVAAQRRPRAAVLARSPSELTVLTGISEAVLRHRDVDAALDEALADVLRRRRRRARRAVPARRPTARCACARSAAIRRGRRPTSARSSATRRCCASVIATGKPMHLPSDDAAARHRRRLLLAAHGRALLLIVPLAATTGRSAALLMVARCASSSARTGARSRRRRTQISQVLALARAFEDREDAEHERGASTPRCSSAILESAPDGVIAARSRRRDPARQPRRAADAARRR